MLYLVFGGELVDPKSMLFRNLKDVEFTGLYADRKEAVAVWRGRAQQTVDNAHMRFFVIELGAFGAKNSTPPLGEVVEPVGVGASGSS